MAKAHPIELRERVVSHVEEGYSHRSTAAHFRVSVKFVNDMITLKRETGSLLAKPVGNRRGSGKLEPYKDWVRSRIEEKADITTTELSLGLKEAFDLDVHAWSVSRMLHRLGLSHKKRHFTPKEQQRVDVIEARHVWKTKRIPFMSRALERLVFIDETSTNTKLIKQTGWSPRGERLYDYVPLGHWQTQTFIAGLRCHGLTAPWVIDCPMNRENCSIFISRRNWCQR